MCTLYILVQRVCTLYNLVHCVSCTVCPTVWECVHSTHWFPVYHVQYVQMFESVHCTVSHVQYVPLFESVYTVQLGSLCIMYSMSHCLRVCTLYNLVHCVSCTVCPTVWECVHSTTWFTVYHVQYVPTVWKCATVDISSVVSCTVCTTKHRKETL